LHQCEQSQIKENVHIRDHHQRRKDSDEKDSEIRSERMANHTGKDKRKF
jgi:hypothetical protein